MPKGEGMGKHEVPEDQSTEQESEFVGMVEWWMQRISDPEKPFIIEWWVNNRTDPSKP